MIKFALKECDFFLSSGNRQKLSKIKKFRRHLLFGEKNQKYSWVLHVSKRHTLQSTLGSTHNAVGLPKCSFVSAPIRIFRILAVFFSWLTTQQYNHDCHLFALCKKKNTTTTMRCEGATCFSSANTRTHAFGAEIGRDISAFTWVDCRANQVAKKINKQNIK